MQSGLCIVPCIADEWLFIFFVFADVGSCVLRKKTGLDDLSMVSATVHIHLRVSFAQSPDLSNKTKNEQLLHTVSCMWVTVS